MTYLQQLWLFWAHSNFFMSFPACVMPQCFHSRKPRQISHCTELEGTDPQTYTLSLQVVQSMYNHAHPCCFINVLLWCVNGCRWGSSGVTQSMAEAVLMATRCGVSHCAGSKEERPDKLVTYGHGLGHLFCFKNKCQAGCGKMSLSLLRPGPAAFLGVAPDCVFLSQIRRVMEETWQEHECSVITCLCS